MSGPEGSERRDRARFLSVNLVHLGDEPREGELSLEEFQAMVAQSARTLDLSATGCRIETPQAVPKGSQVSLDLQLDDVVHSVVGRVAWVRRQGKAWQQGIEFVEPDSMAIDGIRLFLHHEGAPPAPGSDPDARP